MNKKLALLAAPVVALSASTASAGHLWDTANFSPYAGIDAQWRHTTYDNGRGDNLIEHDTPQGNIYVGIKLNKYLALEGGYQSNIKQTRSTTHGPGDIVTGFPIPTGGPTVKYDTTASFHGPHINVVGIAPICDKYRLSLIGSVGVIRMTSNITRKLTYNSANVPAVINPPQQWDFKNTRSILRLSAGVAHMINDKWGVRATVLYENTSRLENNVTQAPAGAGTSGINIKPKNSMSYGVGTFIKF